MPSNIQNIFVLMLENRSFDHMLGFSGITGTDAEKGSATTVNGLSAGDTNSCNGVTYEASQPADLVMPVDPAHEFPNVVTQLCGAGKTYPQGGPYPSVNGSGFVADYVSVAGPANPAEIMKCYSPAQLPVLNALAGEFVVLDQWYSSMPGPTWPNRFFVHAASAGGLDHSPTTAEITEWETIEGFQFQNGTVFQSLSAIDNKTGWRLYSGGSFPNVAALRGINNFEIYDLDDFDADVNSPGYKIKYTFIEPNYGDVIYSTFRGGNSQHPMDDVTHGEALIKSVYESIRKSPVWNTSLFIVTWDEHGGFYDHVGPPDAPVPGDNAVTRGANQFGFGFGHYGVRVPAVVVSPLIPKNLVDHRLYDHASIPRTIEAVFGLQPLTKRDANANELSRLATLNAARTDAPMTLPNPAIPATAEFIASLPPSPYLPTDSVDSGNLPGFLHAALRSNLQTSRPDQRKAILDEFKTIKTRAQAQAYMDKVRVKVKASRAATRRMKANMV